jgi:hypothetical protein
MESATNWDQSVERELHRLRVRTTDWRRLVLLDVRRPDPLPLPARDQTPRLARGEGN